LRLAVAGLAEVGLELNRRFIAERGVEAFGVVDGLDEGADVAAGLAEARVGLASAGLTREGWGSGLTYWMESDGSNPASMGGDL
jgi:hypothetical protein